MAVPCGTSMCDFPPRTCVSTGLQVQKGAITNFSAHSMAGDDMELPNIKLEDLAQLHGHSSACSGS